MTISLSVRFDVLNRDGFTCRYCGTQAPETALEVDHVKPRSQGGSDDMANLVATCRDCNRGKSDKHVTPPERKVWDAVAGKFFHTFMREGGAKRINWQGRVLSDLGHGYHVVQLYEWLAGTPSFYGTRVVHISRMAKEDWAFYETDEDMREAFNYGGCGETPRDDRHPQAVKFEPFELPESKGATAAVNGRKR